MLRSALAVGSLCAVMAMQSPARGVVVDASGRPLKGALIVSLSSDPVVTGDDGAFVVPPKDGQVRILLDGYAPRIVPAVALAEPIVMRAASSRRRDLPRCRPGESGHGAGVLHIPTPEGVDVVAGAGEDELTVTWSRRGATLRHASGPTTTSGLPLERDLSELLDVDDRDVRLVVEGLEPHGFPIADVRGRWPNGRRYRYVGSPLEMFEYSGLTAAEAAVFDRMLDAMCFAVRQPSK